MSGERVGRTRHRIQVAAPAGVVYAVLADAAALPLYFAPSIHVERLDFDGEREHLLVWSLLEGRLMSCSSWRRLDPVERRIEFRQELPSAPLDAVSGVIAVRGQGPARTELDLAFGYSVPRLRAPAAPPRLCADLEGPVHLEGLKNFAERWTRLDDLVLSFEDSLRIHGPAEPVYGFLHRAGSWPHLVPHVTRVALTEDTPGVQRMTMQTLTEDGAHTTESVRICFPHAGRIVYKQTSPGRLVAAHTGEWSLDPDERGVTVTARHRVLLREEAVTDVLGEGARLAHARRHVRAALRRHCRAVLERAARHAANPVPAP
ncbi:SRPBCC family protein [Streptomyces sp. NPDC006610]|jgi:uncharacterized membrane protein|uniref:SRPBCC family protein n=1 Tax=Streptomyces sp. NPDC006610 TaxID=3154584 RepID=UPI0033A9D4B3